MPKNYNFFTSNELKPSGWMLDQLNVQKNGLNGNLDKVWPDIRDSKWIGGDREGWERVPYWLDGFVPLAYLLDDEDMKARAQKYIDKILEGQEEDGWICPNGNTPREKYDTWAVILISKVLLEYYRCSNDERVPDAVYRTLKNFYELLDAKKIKLFEWGEHRWYETFIALQWLKDRFGAEDWMYSLGRILIEQGTDYDALAPLWENPTDVWGQDVHVVNIAMMLKSEALVCRFFGDEYTGLADRLYDKLMKFNGTPVGIFTGDECLSGLSAIQGTELCSVVELMYSLEQLYACTGDKKWAETLETVAFNALPATISDDMWAHQYDQMSNQIACLPMSPKPIFRTNNGEAHLFGLEPHYGCCTANFGQGWPKFMLSAYLYNDDEVLCAVPLPSSLNFKWKNVPVNITLKTEYPFVNKLVYTITADEAVDMTFKIRIPSFAENLRVDGENKAASEFISFEGFAKGETTIEISFDTAPELISRPYGLSSVRCGSLVFSLPIKTRYEMREYVKDGVERKYPYCDYTLSPESDWNFAFASDKFAVRQKAVGSVPFSSENPPVTLEAELCHINWGLEEGFDSVCSKIPRETNALDGAVKAELYPYGCAKLRMTEMPLVKNK